MLQQVAAWRAAPLKAAALQIPRSEGEWREAEESMGTSFQDLMRCAARGDARPAAMRSALTAAAANVAIHLAAQADACAHAGWAGSGQPRGPLTWWRTVLQARAETGARYRVSEGMMGRVADFMEEALGLRDFRPECCLPAQLSGGSPLQPCALASAGLREGVRLQGILSVAKRSYPAALNLHTALGGVHELAGGQCGGIAWFLADGWAELRRWMSEGCILRVSLPHPRNTTMPGPRVWLRKEAGAAAWDVGALTLVAVEGGSDAWGPFSGVAEVRRRQSRFLPPHFRWTDTHRRHADGSPDYSSGLVIKPFATTGVLERKREWLRRVWPLDETCRAILDGKFYFPARPGGVNPVMRPNLRSVEEDKPLLYKMVAKYLITGALEWCPPGTEPQNLIPLGLVPKNDEEEPWRVIADGRQMNDDLLPWQIPMTGMQASAGLFSRGAYCFMKDFSSAYHNVPLGTACGGTCVGCKQCRSQSVFSRRVSESEEEVQSTEGGRCFFRESGLQSALGDMRPLPTEAGMPGQWTRRTFVGCKPGMNCRGTGCQKQLFGIELDGEYFRFSVAHFGIKTAGNAWHALLAPLLRKWRNKGNVYIILWVDDVCVIVPNRCLDPRLCGGPDSCPLCAECRGRARALDEEFTAEIKALGFQTNRKDVGATMRAIFLGLGFDTLTMEFWIPAEKATAFAARCGEMMRARTVSRRALAEVVGKLMWWSAALPHARLLSRSMAHASLGATCRREWDTLLPLPQAAREELTFWHHEVVALARHKMPMVPPTVRDIERLWEELAPEAVFVRPVPEEAGQSRAVAPVPWHGVYVRAAGLRLGHTFYLQRAPGAYAIWFAVKPAAKTGTWHLGLLSELGESAGIYSCACKAEVSLSPAAEAGEWRPEPSGSCCGGGAGFAVVPVPGVAKPTSAAVSRLMGSFRGRLVTDAGPSRWGATLTLPDGCVLRASDFYRPEDVAAGRTNEQAWREGYGVLLAVEAFSQRLTGGVVLHHSDCACVVNAVQSGSVTSVLLQAQATELWRTCARLGVLLYSGWIPGREVVRLGVDGLSRESGVDHGDLRTGPLAREGIERWCEDLGWNLSVDLFASPENSLCTRFCTRFQTLRGETVDAFTRSSWSSYDCVCGGRHAEVVFVFPPDQLLLPVWSRLKRDGARGMALVPKWVSAPWWSILKSGLVRDMKNIPGSDVRAVSNDESRGRRTDPERLRTRDYVLVAFDFAGGTLTLSPPCAQAQPRGICRQDVMSEQARSALLLLLADALPRPPPVAGGDGEGCS